METIDSLQSNYYVYWKSEEMYLSRQWVKTIRYGEKLGELQILHNCSQSMQEVNVTEIVNEYR